MELITYRKTLDVHKNGIQFMLQGFETADNMSRVIEISLMASGDAIDFPLERIMALMYVTTPSATEPSINECTIKDNKVVYNVLPIVEEGITTMQLKLIETSPEGAKHVLAAPKFAVEVNESVAKDESVKQSATFTALEDAVAKAKTVYDERFLRLALDSDCIFRAYYADGTSYETDLLKKMFHEGNSLLAQSFARGDAGVRDNEKQDNAKYYSNVARSESLNAKNIMEDSEEILEEVKLHGVYTAFNMDFEKGELVYISPKYKFKLNTETGELDAEGKAFAPEDVLLTIVKKWLKSIAINLPDDFNKLKKNVDDQGKTIKEHSTKFETLMEIKKTLEDVKGTVLWTKSDEVFSAAGLTIALDLTEYKRIKVSIGGVLVECDRTSSSNFVYYGNSGIYNMQRSWTITDSEITFRGVSFNGSLNNGHENSLMPLKIIGYKF